MAIGGQCRYAPRPKGSQVEYTPIAIWLHTVAAVYICTKAEAEMLPHLQEGVKVIAYQDGPVLFWQAIVMSACMDATAVIIPKASSRIKLVSCDDLAAHNITRCIGHRGNQRPGDL